MRALLDTHTFLWATTDDPRLGPAARSLIQDEGNEIILSAASAWEIVIKYRRGRLPLPDPPETYVTSRAALLGLTHLPIDVRHALRVAALADIHRDPFDRILVAQAMVEGAPILTDDQHIARYQIETIW